MEPMPLSFAGIIHYSAVEGSPRDALRPVRRVREGCRRRDPARLLVHRAEHDRRPRRLPSRDRSGDGSPGSTSRSTHRPRSCPARRSWSGCSTRTGRRLGVGHQRLEHGPADRLGRAGRHLRPRAARDRSRHPIRPHRRASSASRSTAPATGSPPSSCRRGSSRARCTTRSTATPRSSRRCARRGISARRSPSATRRPAPSITCSPARRRVTPGLGHLRGPAGGRMDDG